MNDNGSTATVRIVGDASGVAPATDKAVADITGLRETVAQLSATMKDVSAQMQAALAKVSESVDATRTHVKKLTEETSVGFAGMIGKIHEGAEAVRTFQMRAKEFAEVYVAMFAVESIAHWAESLGAAAEKTEHLSAIMGMTTGQVQALSGAATMSGTNIDMLSKGIAIFDNKALSANTSSTSVGKSFAAMGISANDGSTNMERLLKVADKFHGMADGPTKTALAMQLFGRAGKDMVPFLNQGSAAIEQLNEKTAEYGGVNDKATEQGKRLATSVNESKVAWDGLNNTLTEAFGPLLTQLADGFNSMVAALHSSYEAGGAVKIVFDGMVEVFRGVGEVLATVGDAFSEVFSTTGATSVGWSAYIKGDVDIVVAELKGVILTAELLTLSIKSGCEEMIGLFIDWYGNLRTTFQNAGVALEVLKIEFETFATAAYDAMHFHWDSVAADWDKGMSQIDGVVKSRGAQIVADAKGIADQAKAWLASAAGDDTKAHGLLSTDLFAKHTGPKHDNFKFNFAGGGGGAPDLAAEHGGKGKKPKAAKDTTEALADEHLSMAEKEALAEIKIAEDKNNSLYQLGQRTLEDFVAQELALEDAKYKAVQDFYTKKAAADAKDVVKHQKDLDDLKLAEIAHTEAVARINEQAAEKRRQQAQRETTDYIKELEDRLKIEIGETDERYKQGEITLKQKTQQEKDLTSVVEREVLARLQAEINSYAKDTDQYRAAVKAKEDAERKFTADKKKMDNELLNTERQRYQQMFQPFTDSLSKMLTAQQGFLTTMKSMWSSLQSVVAQVINNMVRNWLVGIATKEAASKAANGKSVVNDAWEAARGAYNSLIHTPFIGPVIAPIAAAASFAAVSAMSAEGGDWQVKPGLYELHKDEMVLPAWAARPLRSMVEGGGSVAPGFAANDSGSAGGGDTHVHIHATDADSVVRLFTKHKHKIAGALDDAVREGYRSKRKAF